MALIKCPRCELNYMQSTDKYCAVCRREMRGEDERETVELCSNCGERPVVPGEEFCAVCLKETKRGEDFDGDPSDNMMPDDAMGLTSAGEMDEIDLELDENAIPASVKSDLNDDVDFVSLDGLEEDGDEEEDDQ